MQDCREFDNAPLPNASIKGILGGKKGNGAKKTASVFKVQFNPNSMKFSTAEKEFKRKKADISKSGDGSTRTTEAQNEGGRIFVKLSLIFDRTIYHDCSVQPEVERFIALVQNPYVRQVAFYWGTMCYKGVVNGVDAEYVMFNEKGIPMRANVDFSIEID